MIKQFLLAGSLLYTLSTQSQINWPPVNPTTKPWTRWWWPGSAMNPGDLTQNMESYAKVGLGGVEITPIYGVGGFENQFVDYLSPQWMNLLTHTLNEGKRLNLQIDMATGSGWPFGGGPLIGAAEACKEFVYKTYSLKAGERLKETITYTQEPYLRKVGNTLYDLKSMEANAAVLKEAAQLTDVRQLTEPVFNNKNLQALAIDQVKFKKELPLQVLMAYNKNGQTIDLTSQVDAKGQLNWTAPAGDWTLYALFMGWHGKMVERAAPGAEGDVIDHFSLPALTKYLSRFDTAFAGKDISHLRGFFNDSYEVDDARGQANYTPALWDEFKKRRGYDLRRYLPALLSKNPNDTGLRVLYDYRQTIADLLLEKFTIPWQQWAKAKGKIVRNQSHGSPANILDLYGAVDIPETEGTELLRFKFAASASHVLGKPLTAAEAATWLNEHFKSSLGDVKLAVDKYFLGGVNHIVYHGTCYSPQSEPWPGWLFYAAVHFQPTNPLWKDFGTLNDYVARCQSFLQSGKHDNNVLLYFPFSDRNSEPATARGLLHHYDGMEGFDNTDFKKVAETLTEKGYAWDLISDKQIQQLTNTGGLLKAPGGTYKTIILANTKYLPAATLQKLKTLIQQGAKVIVYKNLPVGAPGMEGLTNKQGALAGVLKGENIVELLTKANVAREAMYDKGLQCIRRSINSGKYYFITNTHEKAFSGWIPLGGRVPLATKAAGIAMFDPMQHRRWVAKTRTTNGVTEVLLQLQPGESCVLQTFMTGIKGEAYPYHHQHGTPTIVSGAWDVQFVSGGPTLPATTTMTGLVRWNRLPDSAASIFSGTALYRIRFPRPTDKVEAFMLDLGMVSHSAVVRLNGRPPVTLIGPNYQIFIPANWLTNDNELTIEVTSGMANRMADMDKRGVEWKKFYNVNFPSRLPANRSPNGLFTAAGWAAEDAGLIGTVILIPLSLMP